MSKSKSLIQRALTYLHQFKVVRRYIGGVWVKVPFYGWLATTKRLNYSGNYYLYTIPHVGITGSLSTFEIFGVPFEEYK